MKLGIVGLPNVGKSTLFNSLTKAGAESANYPFCTIDPNVGVVTVPDERLDRLAALYNSAKITPAVIEFVDIAGLVKGASKGEGLGNQFLANIREVDAIVHVVRCFEDSNIVHVDGSIDPLRDIETINLELIFSDMEVLERRLSKQKRASYNNKEIAKECDLIERLIAFLEAGNLAKNFELEDEDEEAFFKEYNLLTAKPVIFAANVTEDDLANDGADNKYVQAVREFAEKEHCGVFVICAQIEQEISELDDDEKKMFLEDLGLKSSGLDKLISASYSLLGLISYLTAGETETRAWTITKGTKAPQAAGKIHSDFERGFIKAEVVSYDDLINCGSYNAAKEKGIAEACKAGELLKENGFNFDKAYTSYLKRAVKTLNCVLDRMDQDWIPVEKSWRLNEKHYGDLQGLNKSETAAKYGDEQVLIWRRSYDIAPNALSEDDPRNPRFENRYQEVPDAELPRTESLKDTIERIMPYWKCIIFPNLKTADEILVVAHGNSLRGIIKHLKHISDEEIVKLNLPTAVPYVFEFSDELNLEKDYFLGDPEEIRKLMEAVANQGKKK